ncbi:FAD-binding protein [Candidatus Binatus sp.]|uniref:FAD-dependent oxidoreductase n=1 Tax=Candidatus Binatus sp. TaxID=2811406 RepID=UPI003BB072DD
MNRRSFLRAIGSAALLPILPRRPFAATTNFRRRRPSDATWPSQSAWKQLNETVGGNLIPVDFPINKLLDENIRNPYYIGDQPGLTETLGWVDAWATKPSVYAVAARNANDIAAAVNFARENDLRLVVKGGGHSYQGTSNAPDSLLIWTRHMHDIEMHDQFVPQGCEHAIQPQPAVTVGAGTIGMQAYDVVTTKGGKYVQGGGCTTVCLGGLVQSGGFGSYSKHYGTAAGGLLEAEVVTADGQIRIANACTNPDLFWALKGGGGGSFGVVSKMTLRVHDLPEFFGAANFTVKAASDDAYRRLIREFVSFYHDHLFNDHWGEQAHVKPDNTLEISMTSYGLNQEQARKVWQPFLDWVARSPNDYSLKGRVNIGSIPARHWWEVQWWKEHWPEIAFPRDGVVHGLLDDVLVNVLPQPLFDFDTRPGASPNNAWWKGDAGQVAWFIWGFESLWMPASMLEPDSQQRLADALFAASRHSGFELHFNKGLGGAPPDAIAAAKDTATNPAVLTAFALVIAGDAQKPAYPGSPGHEPSVAEGREARKRVHQCVDQLRAIVPNPGAYVSESNYFENGFQQAYWGGNHARLADIKKKYDPDGLFFVHNGVGSEQWSPDGFTKL